MSRLYVYGLLAADATVSPQAFGPGLAGLAVTRMAGRGMAALVSADVTEPVPAVRRNLLAHTAVLERGMATVPLLPVRFGTVAPDADTLVACLDRHAEVFAHELERVAGRVELGVKASWQDGALSAEAMAADPALAAWRDRLAGRPAAELYYDRIELGRRVQTAIAARRDSVVREIAAVLAPLAERSADLRLLDESMILNQAFLVPSADEPAFDAAMDRLALRFGERVTFRYVGPVPPYNFVDVRADWLAGR